MAKPTSIELESYAINKLKSLAVRLRKSPKLDVEVIKMIDLEKEIYQILLEHSINPDF